MLHLYLAEAEGRLICLPDIAKQAIVSAAVITRWSGALAARGFVVTDPHDRAVCELCQQGLMVLERILLIARGIDPAAARSPAPLLPERRRRGAIRNRRRFAAATGWR